MSDFRLDSMKLDYLLKSIDEGALKLPSFQRDFKWKQGQIKKLLDSIQKKHPAGSLLFLEVNPRKKLIQDEPFKYAEIPTDTTADYLVLDGQQRLTSCYSVFYNKGDFKYFLNLLELHKQVDEHGADNMEFESFIISKKVDFYPDQYLAQHLLPFYFLISKDVLREKLASYKQNLRETNFDPGYINFIETKLESILDPFFDYRFPTIALPKTLTLDGVCKVFQSINTTGLRLSAFDICVARFMSDGQDLKNKLKTACTDYPNLIPVLEKDETIVLQTIALLSDKSPKRDKLADNLTKEDLRLWDKAIIGLNQSIELLNDWGVGLDKNVSLLPYQPTIPVIASVIVDREYERQDVPSQASIKQKLKRWFYTVCLMTRYNEGTDNKMRDDFLALKKWILDDSNVPDYIGIPIYWHLDQTIKLNRGGAIGKTLLCCLNMQKPSDFYTGQQVGVGRNVIESQLHHIFPKGTYKSKYGDLINSVFNYTYLTPDSNNYIRNKDTSTYVDGIMTARSISSDTFKTELKGHLINNNAYDNLINQNYEQFLKERVEEFRICLIQNVGLDIRFDSQTHDIDTLDEEYDLSED
ncbi:MAG TPA: DUF262 domain-containing protein [Candidatus Bathyarchaeia archaeon]|nr:DUF262 domain-containing protein [Candidatus Bathyarchaeia archaeon]